MTPTNAKRTPTPVIFVIGLFFGVIVGVFLTLALSSSGTTETFEESQNRVKRPSTETPAPRGTPPGGPSGTPPHGTPQHGAPGDRASQSIAKVHFMKKFVMALVQKPLNKHPNLEYAPLLKDVGNPLRCRDCHDPSKVDVERMMALDPGPEKVEPFRQSPQFMIALMTEWVGKLNRVHAARLTKPVTCTDCHAVDPREKFDVYPALMRSFVHALREKPTNRNPAAGWKPLLKETAPKGMLCSVCHGEIGVAMERNLDKFNMERPAKYADDKTFMVHLMEEWVEELNEDFKDHLRKAVVCRDCHETDPRR